MTEVFLSYHDTHNFFDQFSLPIIKNMLSHLANDFNLSSISIQIFMQTDDELLAVNSKFLNHDYYTDIITFNYSKNNVLLGDLYISGDRCFENAAEYRSEPLTELFRYIIHGTLHLCGMDDNTDELRMAMKEKEDYYLSIK